MTTLNDTSTSPAQRSRQAHLALQERIKEWILERELSVGDPMPTEAEMVEQLGFSRNSIREALKSLPGGTHRGDTPRIRNIRRGLLS